MTAGDADDASVRRRGGRPSRRDEIVRAAAEAFATTGYHNTSLNDIAEQLAMTPAGILHHFGSKENLLTEVLQLRDTISRTSQNIEGPAMLRHMVATAARNESNPGLTQLYAVLSAESVTPDHPAQAWFRTRYSTLRDQVNHALREAAGLPTGHQESESLLAARALIAAMDGLQVQFLLDDRARMAQSLEFTVQALVAALRDGE